MHLSTFHDNTAGIVFAYSVGTWDSASKEVNFFLTF